MNSKTTGCVSLPSQSSTLNLNNLTKFIMSVSQIPVFSWFLVFSTSPSMCTALYVDTQFRHKWSHKCVALFVHTCENDSESLSLYLPPHPVQLYYYSHGFFLHVALVGGSNTKYTWRWVGWLTDSKTRHSWCNYRAQVECRWCFTCSSLEHGNFTSSKGAKGKMSKEIYKIHHIAHTISQLINWIRLLEFNHNLKARNESSFSLNIYLN